MLICALVFSYSSDWQPDEDTLTLVESMSVLILFFPFVSEEGKAVPQEGKTEGIHLFPCRGGIEQPADGRFRSNTIFFLVMAEHEIGVDYGCGSEDYHIVVCQRQNQR